MAQPKRHNKSMKETMKQDRCETCMMNTICTWEEKNRGTLGKCPDSVVFPDEKKKESGDGIVDDMLKVGDIPLRAFKHIDMVPVMKMEYWDGSKFIMRTDKAGYKKILCKLRVKMRSRLLDLPEKKQIEIAQLGGMLKRTEEMMSEAEYLKIKKE